MDVHLVSCWLCYSMAKAHRSSFGQKISLISRIFPWNDAPDPVIASCYAMLLLIPASAPQVPGQIHTKLLFYTTEPRPVPTWQISIIFKFRWPTGHRLYTMLCVRVCHAFTQVWFQSISKHIVPKDDNHQKRWSDWGEKGQRDVQTKKCVRDKVSDKETAKAVKRRMCYRQVRSLQARVRRVWDVS